MSHFKYSFNDSFEQFAAITNDNRIKIWDTQTNKLKTQIVPSAHLSSSYTCLRWAPTLKVNGVNQHTIALGTNQGEIYCWNINQGETIFAIKPDDSFVGKQINDICFTKDGNSFFSCANCPTILQYDLKSNILARFKGDKSSVSRISISEDGLYLISAGTVFVKVWEISSGRLISKFSAHRTSINNLLFTPNHKQILLSSVDQRIFNLWSFNEDENSANEILQSFSAQNPPTFLAINNHLHKNDTHILAAIGKKVCIWQYNDSLRQNKPLTDTFSLSLPQTEQTDKETYFLSATFCDKDTILTARGSLIKPKFDKIKYFEKGKIIQNKSLSTLCTGNFITDAREVVTKSQNGASNGVTLLSTPDINKISSSRKEVKNSKFKSDTLEPTLEEKLEQFENQHKSQLETKNESHVPKLTSIHSTLIQAIQTNDISLLASCLNTTNERLISNTVKNLPHNVLVPFLQTLIERFHSKPKSVIYLVPWIRATLIHHTSYLMTIPQFGENSLSSLYQTIDSRLSIFGQLLKLSGRLDVVLSQIDQRDDYLDNNPILSLNENEVSDDEDNEDEEEEGEDEINENDDDDDEGDDEEENDVEDNFVDDYSDGMQEDDDDDE